MFPIAGISQTPFKNFLLEKTFADFSISTTQGSFQIAAGYKFREYLGVGVGISQSEKNKPGLGVNIRGTNMKNSSQKFGLYYTAGWWLTVHSFDDFESNSLFEIGAGVRYKDLALTTGYGWASEKIWENLDAGRQLQNYRTSTIQLKISYLLNSYRGERPFLKKMFRGNAGKNYPAFVFDAALGRAFLISSGVDLRSHYVAATTLDLSLGRQFSSLAGVAISVHSAGSASQGARYSLGSVGLSFRGELGVFYYRATIAALTKFSLVDDFEYPREKFNKQSGLQPVLHFQGGIRLFRRLLLGGGYQWSPEVRGTYRHYDLTDFANPVLDLEKKRKTYLSSWQVILGVSF